MKILVTGPKGFVGARIMSTVHEAIPAPSLRTADEDTIKHLTDGVDLIIHTAAISDIPTCEKNPQESFHANVELPVMLAKTGAKLIAFSTDQVYSGCTDDGPYSEAITAPANLYGRHKLEMEQRVLDINPDAIMLRATWMYDMPMYGVRNRGNFLVNMLKETEISFSSSSHRAVTYVREIAENIMMTATLPGGAYNYGSENDLTMLETAQWLKSRLDLAVELKDAGPHHNLWMNCGKIREHGIRFRSTIDGLNQCIEDYGLL